MFRIIFGNIGCGKTTYACKMIYDNLVHPKHKFYSRIFTNFKNKLCPDINLTDIGKWTLPFNSYLVVDEAGIQYNNRKFKSLPQHTIEWFKLSRHYGVDADFLSQSWDDIDITIRRLADEIWYLKKVGPFTVVRRIFKRIQVNEETHQIEDGYFLRKFFGIILDFLLGSSSFKIFLRYPYYKFFDTYDAPKVPIRYSYDTNFGLKRF